MRNAFSTSSKSEEIYKIILKLNIFFIFSYLVFSNSILDAHIPSKEETIVNHKKLESLNTPKCLSIPEGGFVYFYNSNVEKWLQEPLNIGIINNIQSELSSHLDILLTKEGFAAASSRRNEDELDITNYSAIWVRDCCWIYYGLKLKDVKKAKKLILSLLDFYSSDGQISRFLSIIQNPKLADPDYDQNALMNVPLIRFSAKTLSDWQVDGKDQFWNHIQFDSHGLFLLALSDALDSRIIEKEDLKPKFFEVLALFPAFFSETHYEKKKDAGPWEEELLYNASSAGLVAAGQKKIMQVINDDAYLKNALENALKIMRKKYNNNLLINKLEKALSSQNIQNLYQEGIDRAEKNINLGGEAICLDGSKINRKADAALLFLCTLKNTPYYNDSEKIKQILNICSSLIGPYGIYRYKYDAYQAMNYWISYEIPSAISGENTSELRFMTRLQKGYMPHKQFYDAQWFFDSYFAIAYYRLSFLEKDFETKKYYLSQGDIHLKRTLAQLTDENTYAANGEKLKAWQLPESINTVADQENGIKALTSPICPLNWAKAALLIALDEAKMAHNQIEK